jgi:hypothetical protein
MPPRSAVKDTETIYSQNSRGLRTDKLEEVMATLMKLGLLAWIDIANDRTLWTSLVYELFHDAKDY